MMDSFNIDEYFKFDEFCRSPEQTVSQSGSPLNKSSQLKPSTLYPQGETYLQNAFDGHSQLPEMPSYNTYIPSALAESPSQPRNVRQYDLGELSQHQEHCQIYDKQEIPLYGQAMSDSYNPIEMPPFDSNTMDPNCLQQGFQQSELDFTPSTPNRQSSHGAVSAESACANFQPMGGLVGLGRVALPRIPMRCDWPSCIRLRFDTREGFISHQKAHFTDLSDQWEKPSGCSWHGCRSQKSGKVFKTQVAYRKHLRKHIKVHWCDYDGCTYNKPFGTQHDLNRHGLSAHSDEHNFICPIDSCPRSTLGFPRKDKLDDHTRKEHDNFQCTFDHCDALVLEHERNNHLEQFHSGKPSTTFHYDSDGVYECALAGCESTTSVFNGTTARRHLNTHHSVSFDASLAIITSCETPAATAKSDVFIMRTDRPHKSCKICLRKRSVGRDIHQAVTLNSNS